VIVSGLNGKAEIFSGRVFHYQIVESGGKIRLCRQSNAYGRLFFRMYAEKVPF